MNSEYWPDFWKQHGQASSGEDEQSQVLRTFNKQPITKERWQQTLEYLARQIPVSGDDLVLDLCSGNGLLTSYFASLCKSITAVDISADLLEKIEQHRLVNVRTLQSDIRKLNFDEGSFTCIIIYAGIQYLTESESVILFKKMFNWLKPGGLLFIGDIPDRARLWTFYNTNERKALYFEYQAVSRDVVGTWFDESWLLNLALSIGFQAAQVIHQPSEQIYAHFRFDLKVQR
jgi:SAM-dependent methyltransferase